MCKAVYDILYDILAGKSHFSRVVLGPEGYMQVNRVSLEFSISITNLEVLFIHKLE